jgi:hypothetical protein
MATLTTSIAAGSERISILASNRSPTTPCHQLLGANTDHGFGITDTNVGNGRISHYHMWLLTNPVTSLFF